MPIKLLTFDLDHTLWDTDPVIRSAEQAMMAWIASHSPETLSLYDINSFHEYKLQVAQSYPELKPRLSALRTETLYRIFLQTGHDSPKARLYAEEAFNVFHQERSKLPLYNHVAETMTRLKSKYSVIAISNGNADLKLAGYHHFFDHYLNPDITGVAKPAPDMFINALDKAGVQANEAIHIGDHPEQDIWAAQQVGMKTIWFNNKSLDWPLETTKPDAEYSHWSELIAKLEGLANSN